MLVGVKDDAEIHPVHCCVSIGDVYPAPKILRRFCQMSFLHGIQRAFQPSDDLRLCGDTLLHTFFKSVGIFGPVTLSR